MHEDKTMKSDQIKVRGTVKVEKLTVDPGCPDLLTVSVYDDTKLVHFLLAAAEKLNGFRKRELYNSSQKR